MYKRQSFDGIDIALFAGGSISKTLAPEAAKRGAIAVSYTHLDVYKRQVQFLVFIL